MLTKFVRMWHISNVEQEETSASSLCDLISWVKSAQCSHCYQLMFHMPGISLSNGISRGNSIPIM